ncbi:hypothetical protein Tco_1236554 [Tanacetum coccineum]
MMNQATRDSIEGWETLKYSPKSGTPCPRRHRHSRPVAKLGFSLVIKLDGIYPERFFFSMIQDGISLEFQRGCEYSDAHSKLGLVSHQSHNSPDQLNTEAEVVQIILTWIDNDIYSTVDACPNAFLTSTTTKMEKHEFDEIIAKRQERTANPLALVAQQQPAYHPQNHPTHYTKKSSTRSQQAATRTNHDREQDDQDDNDLAKERDLLAL